MQSIDEFSTLQGLVPSATNELTAMESRFAVKVLNMRPGDTVLDAPCGGGRHSLLLTVAGMRIHGVDVSEKLIRHAAKLVPSAQFRCADITQTSLPQNYYDATVSFYSCLGYSCCKEKDIGFLSALSAVTKSGKLILLGTANAEALRSTVPQISDYTCGSWRIARNIMLQSDVLVQYFEFTNLDTGESSKMTQTRLVYAPNEIARMVEKASLELCAIFSDFAGAPFCSESSPHAVYIFKSIG